MRKRYLAASIALSLTTASVHAENSVTLYGLIDMGFDFNNNVSNVANGSATSGGGKLYRLQSGVPLGSRWGLLGDEDLGGGLHTVFRLESGFDASTGALGGGLAFSRNAYVGLKSDRFGSVLFGRQWDANVDLLEPFTLNGRYGGWYFAHPNDMDNLDNGFSVPNAIKYVSPNVGGVTVEGHYSPGGQAGQFSTNATYSAAAAYQGGAIGLGVGYLRVNNPQTAVAGYQSGGGFANSVYGDALAAARSQSVIAAGAAYTVDAFSVSASFSDTVFRPVTGGNNLSFQNYELSGTYQVNSALLLGAGFTYTVGHNDVTGGSPRYEQINLIAQYSVSKRTSVYAMLAGQNASGDASVAQIAGFNPSTTSRQVASRLGITHKF
jgi:predicted porin